MIISQQDTTQHTIWIPKHGFTALIFDLWKPIVRLRMSHARSNCPHWVKATSLINLTVTNNLSSGTNSNAIFGLFCFNANPAKRYFIRLIGFISFINWNKSCAYWKCSGVFWKFENEIFSFKYVRFWVFSEWALPNDNKQRWQGNSLFALEIFRTTLSVFVFLGTDHTVQHIVCFHTKAITWLYTFAFDQTDISSLCLCKTRPWK